MDKIIDNGLPIEGFLIFQTVFCATAATIVSGAMAERTKFSMYLVYTVFISVLIYPVSGHWTWGGGWLMNGDEGSFMMRTFGTTFHDFAGSTVVHSVGVDGLPWWAPPFWGRVLANTGKTANQGPSPVIV